MKITFDIPDDKLNHLISALTSAIDNAYSVKRDNEGNDDEIAAAFESDENILTELLAQVEDQTKMRT